MTRLKEERKVNLRKKRVKSHKMTLNVLIVVNKGIMLKTATRNRNKMEESEQKSKF
jgi:hypothetical protein